MIEFAVVFGIILCIQEFHHGITKVLLQKTFQSTMPLVIAFLGCMTFKGKKVVVMGLARSGVGAANLLHKTLLSVLMVFSIGCTSFHTPEIRGKVTDAETGKPLAGVNVKAVWKVGVGTPGGVGGDPENYKYHKTRTDKNGQFVLPEMEGRKKAVIGTYEGVTILVYRLGYRPGFLESFRGRAWGYKEDSRNTDFILKPLKTEEDYYDGYEHTSWSSVGYDHRFQIEYLYDYLEKYPQSKEGDGIYIRIARHYQELGEYENARKIYELMKKQFPNSDSVGFANERIKDLRKKELIK